MSAARRPIAFAFMRASPVTPAPGPIKTAAMFAAPIVMSVVLAAMLVYGWSTP